MTDVAPRTVRRIGSPAAAALADLAAIFDDLQTVLLCCERLVAELRPGLAKQHDEVLTEALWTTALISYSRCFAGGERGMGLTEDDVEGLELKGEKLAWHRMLRRLKKHFADPAANPRETFTVGVAVADGAPAGVAITSARQDPVDEQTVRQTGALAFALSKLVDARIAEHQATVLEGAQALTTKELETLDEIEVTGDGAPPPRPEDDAEGRS
ncbi:hypothetical protein GCM10023201_39110 [Actinomycetospora corticicola]|uniref:Uncharacterized protein n=1 Tax=Actinomycetospora corticicola TaxID=663602 RepID=A0A7Y9J7F6_9PSEU|nr:hypothetical protein [Actinomycetospora corticicola]NYD37986.1 hypothetical protein [Actinomycetospora corticicola]